MAIETMDDLVRECRRNPTAEVVKKLSVSALDKVYGLGGSGGLVDELKEIGTDLEALAFTFRISDEPEILADARSELNRLLNRLEEL